MAEEQPKTTPVEAQNTTAQDTAPETATEAPKADTEGTDGAEKPTTTETTSSDNKDTDMKDADVATAGPQATTEVTAPDGEGKTEVADLPSEAADASATPSTGKNGKRKSTGGVPEHKTKKLNKKKSTVQLNLDVKEGEYYWARLKGYPPWPSIVCDEEMLPETLLGTRPVSAKRTDGSYREDFADGGKNSRDRTYPVMFLGTNEFSWMVNTALTKLEPGDCAEDKQTGKMSKALKGAYEVAEEGNDLQHFKDMLNEFMEASKKQQEEEAAKQAEKEAKAAKKAEKAEKAAAEKGTKEKKDRRKSKSKETISDEDDMELDIPEETEAKPSKKRKKDADSEGEGAKPKKTPKSLKITASKTPNGESTKKAAAKPKKTVTKPEEDEPKEAALTEAEKFDRRDKAVLYLRHRLQKGFLVREQAPKEDEMAIMADFFSQLEGYQDLEPQILRTTKIYKVLRGIIKLSSIPKEEEFQFKKRSAALLNGWENALKGDEKENEKAVEKVEQKENGDKADKAEVSIEKEDTKEPSAAPVETVDLGNDATDEKDAAMTDAKDDKPEEKAEEPKETEAETAA